MKRRDEMEYDIEKVLPDLQERTKHLKKISQKYNKKIPEILNDSIITYFALIIKPRLSDYDIYLLEMGRKIKGVEIRNKFLGRKSGAKETQRIENKIGKILEDYELTEINENLLNYSFELIDRTLKAIFDKESELKNKKIYETALSNLNFLYMMLQLAVRLIGQELKRKDVNLKNRTLNYMLDKINDDRSKTTSMFKKAKTKKEVNDVLLVYHKNLEKYFNDFMEREVGENVKWKEVVEIIKERSLVEEVGENIILLTLGIVIFQLQDKYKITLPLVEREKIIIKESV